MRADSSRLLVIAALAWATSVFSPDKRTHNWGWKVDDFAERLASRFARACLWHRARSDLDGRRGYSTFLGHIGRSWKLDVYKSGSPSTAFFLLCLSSTTEQHFYFRPSHKNGYVEGISSNEHRQEPEETNPAIQRWARLLHGRGRRRGLMLGPRKCFYRQGILAFDNFSFLTTSEGPQGATWTGLRRRETSKSWKG
ncbi:hypothetical protein CGRA01v4_09138 [Colletotrichum graminicola]|nr:hypothetical protein CGRA01v4_09138 [Colletotrichum graminicola]